MKVRTSHFNDGAIEIWPATLPGEEFPRKKCDLSLLSNSRATIRDVTCNAPPSKAKSVSTEPRLDESEVVRDFSDT